MAAARQERALPGPPPQAPRQALPASPVVAVSARPVSPEPPAGRAAGPEPPGPEAMRQREQARPQAARCRAGSRARRASAPDRRVPRPCSTRWPGRRCPGSCRDQGTGCWRSPTPSPGRTPGSSSPWRSPAGAALSACGPTVQPRRPPAGARRSDPRRRLGGAPGGTPGAIGPGRRRGASSPRPRRRPRLPARVASGPAAAARPRARTSPVHRRGVRDGSRGRCGASRRLRSL